MKYKRDLKALEQRWLRGARLLKRGVPQAEVARRCAVSRQTASAWERLLKEKGTEGMRRRPSGRPRQLTQTQCAELSKVLLEGALAQGFATELWTLPRVAKLIRERFGIRYSAGHMWHLLRRLGFSCQKPARRATQRNEVGIERWKKRRWPRYLASSKSRRRSSIALVTRIRILFSSVSRRGKIDESLSGDQRAAAAAYLRGDGSQRGV